MIVNTEALDLGLGSGGFDVVHVNLTRGLGGGRAPAGRARNEAQLHVASTLGEPDRERAERGRDATHTAGARVAPARPAGAGGLGGAGEATRGCGWATSRPRGRARRVRCRATSPIFASVAARRPCTRLRIWRATRGDQHRRALDAAARLGWDAVICGPGPGILGSATEYGHGGIAALENAHAALALGLPTWSRRGYRAPIPALGTAG